MPSGTDQKSKIPGISVKDIRRYFALQLLILKSDFRCLADQYDRARQTIDAVCILAGLADFAGMTGFTGFSGLAALSVFSSFIGFSSLTAFVGLAGLVQH